MEPSALVYDILMVASTISAAICLFALMFYLLDPKNARWKNLTKRSSELWNIPRGKPVTHTSTILSDDEDDISAYCSTVDIFRSGHFSASKRIAEYRRRGKPPSGVIDGVYNDMNLEPGHSYNDMDRDWDADA